MPRKSKERKRNPEDEGPRKEFGAPETDDMTPSSNWSADTASTERVPAGLWKLLMRAGVSNEMMADLEVKAVCEGSVRALRELNEAGWAGSAKGPG